MSLATTNNELSIDFDRLPLILAGPILRRTDPKTVTVWIALQKPRLVTLNVYATEEGKGEKISQQVLQGSRHTIALGKFLHIVAVTARSIDHSSLQPSQIYAYDLAFGDCGETLNQALNIEGSSEYNISYFEHSYPTFAMCPDDLNQLQIVHGSCRKPHGGGKDALPMLDTLMEMAANSPEKRPHQLFLTGDQIYGDDVADPLLWAVSQVGTAVLGWEEDLPIHLEGIETKKTSELIPGSRSDLAENWAGLTAMLDNKPDKAKSHLFSLGEYIGSYLLAWSSVLFPEEFPANNSECWKKELPAIRFFREGLAKVRRTLANVSTYMVCDDHDVTDDWYLNREWCYRVLSKPLGRRTVQNGILTYALFQAWGNTPGQFMGGNPGEKLLKAAVKWSSLQGKDTAIDAEIQRYLGIPEVDPETGLPKMKLDGDVWILDRDESKDILIKWHFDVRLFKHEVIVIDSRTWRGYPQESTILPPMLLCHSAFETQLKTPLEVTDQLKEKGLSDVEVTFVVLPTNLVSLRVIDLAQEMSLKKGSVFGHDVGDAWNFHKGALSKLLTTLGERRDRVIILSGDIHYACAVRLHYWSYSQGKVKPCVFAQLTSSAFKNAEWKTQIIHTKTKSLAPESSERWFGWHSPPQLVEVVATPEKTEVYPIQMPTEGPVLYKDMPPNGYWELVWQIAVQNSDSLPNWQYQVEWIERQKAETLYPTQPIQKNTKPRSNPVLWLWRNRWLQEGKEVVGRSNFGIVSLQWTEDDNLKAVIQDTVWHPAWEPDSIVRSRYFVPLRADKSPPLPSVIEKD
ncbi:MAG: PhoD-like phosphatase [Chroococcales cyanobacterium]